MDTDKKIKIMMLPWLAHGHISPFFELAKRLAKRNFIIYLCSTPINLISVDKKLGKLSPAPAIQLVEFHIQSLPTLPPHYHTTNGLPPHLQPTLFKAVDASGRQFTALLDDLKPDLLIHDFFPDWAPSIASYRNIPSVHFMTSSALMISSVYRTSEKPVNFIDLSEMILIKSFAEMEGKYISYFSDLCEKKILPVGPLLQDHHTNNDNSKTNLTNDDDDDPLKIIEWLNKKNPNSTVFISFGSEHYLSSDDIREIARGLEISDINFLWVLRFPKEDHEDSVGGDEKKKSLPEGFIESVGERGLVVTGWVPQANILSHRSIAGFISHCGWSSINESMALGIPIIAMPRNNNDQPYNARLVEEVGVGVRVVKDGDEMIHGETLAAIIKQLVVGEGGERIRKNVRKMSENMRDKGEQDLDVAVEALMQLFNKGK